VLATNPATRAKTPAPVPDVDVPERLETVLTEARFTDWIATGKPGEVLQYHEGLLLLDRSPTGSALPAKERARLHAVARRAWIACELGLVHLLSRKIAEGHYQYLAVRARHSLTPTEVRACIRQTLALQALSKPN